MLVLFRPWPLDGGRHAGSISWESFCDYIRHLKQNIPSLPPYINSVRLAWIENASKGLQVDDVERATTTKFCHREATKWNQLDGTATLLPGDPIFDEMSERDATRRAASAAIIDQMRAETDVLTISASSQAADVYTNEICENIDRLFAAVPAPNFDLISHEVVDELFNSNPIISPTLIDKTIRQKKIMLILFNN